MLGRLLFLLMCFSSFEVYSNASERTERIQISQETAKKILKIENALGGYLKSLPFPGEFYLLPTEGSLETKIIINPKDKRLVKHSFLNLTYGKEGEDFVLKIEGPLKEIHKDSTLNRGATPLESLGNSAMLEMKLIKGETPFVEYKTSLKNQDYLEFIEHVSTLDGFEQRLTAENLLNLGNRFLKGFVDYLKDGEA